VAIFGRAFPIRAAIWISRPPPASGAGAQNLAPDLYADADTFYTQVVSASYTLAPALFEDADTFFTQVVASTYAVTAALYVDNDTFFTQVVSYQNTIVPALYVDADGFFTHAVVGAQNLAPALFVDSDTFHTAILVQPNQLDITSTNVLQFTVDAVLAGDQIDYEIDEKKRKKRKPQVAFRKWHADPMNIKRIFRE
jgi:hypothetical protein